MNPMEKALEFFKCKDDIKYFAENYIYINDPQTYSTFKFEAWDFQNELFDTFDKYNKTIVLKGRQLGVSWCVDIFALHRVMFFNNSNVLILSKREDEAQQMVAKIKFMYNHLPEWMRAERPIHGRDGGNKKEMILEKKDSRGQLVHRGRVLALPATKDAGRSETASIVIADEWAFHKYAEENWTAISPTIDSGGKFIGVSTANGLGNFYYKQWKSAERGGNGFEAVFLSYDLRPGRDEVWYEETKRGYRDEKLFHQEYPRSPMEAFITTGGCIFDLEGLQFLADNVCKEPMKFEALTKNMGIAELVKQWPEVKVWHLPRLGAKYVIGSDPAGGDAGSDFSAAYVLDILSNEQVASIHGRIDPNNFAGLVAQLAELYNNALVIVERNNHGYAVHDALKNQYNYNNIFTYKKDRQFSDGDNKVGMPSNSKTKPIMETHLQVKLRERQLTVYDLDFVFEAQSYVRKGNGRTGADSDDEFDDRVSAMMLAVMAMEHGGVSKARAAGHQVRTKVAGHFRTRHRK